MKEQTEKHSKIWIVLLLIVVFALTAVIGWLLYDRKEQQIKTEHYIDEIQRAVYQRDSIHTELSSLYEEYEYLKQNNDSLKTELSQEQQKIEKLLRQLKTAGPQKMEEYKREIETLRKIMRGYIGQLDSLNRLNQDLTQENVRIKTDYNQAVNRNTALRERNDSLAVTIDKAATVKATNITIMGLNKRDRATRKIDKLEKLEICFTLTENEITPTGDRDVFIRIARPDGIILSNAPTNLFPFEDKQIVYSEKRHVNYTGESQQLCIYWKNEEILLPGTYSIDIFMDSKRIGSTTIVLD